MVAHVLASELVAQPCADAQVSSADAHAEALALVVLPVAFKVGAVGSAIESVAPGFASAVHLSGVEPGGVDAHAADECVGLETADDDAATGITCQPLALVGMQGARQREAAFGQVDGHVGVAFLGIACHHVEAFVLWVMAL